jgi:hypothetical protein
MRPLKFLAAFIATVIIGGLANVTAQVRGIPVYAPWILEGGGVAADFAAAGIRSGQRLEAWPVAVTGEMRFARWTLSVTGSDYRPLGEVGSGALGGTASWQVGREDFAYVQGGFGYSSSQSVRLLHALIGAGLPMTACIANDYFYPWATPRVDILHVSAPLQNAHTDVRFGYSGGVHFELRNGLGFQAAVDGVVQRANRLTIGIGLHFAFGKSLLRAQSLRHASCDPF